MGFEALFGQKKLRHEAGEAGNAQGRPEITSIDLENGTVTLSGLAEGAAARRGDAAADGTGGAERRT
jgi:hypothetical protein